MESNDRVCRKLKAVLELLKDPDKWKEADEGLRGARELLSPIAYETPEATKAWAEIHEQKTPPLVSPGTSDSATIRDAVRQQVELAVGFLCH